MQNAMIINANETPYSAFLKALFLCVKLFTPNTKKIIL